jgi:hypothetical protein
MSELNYEQDLKISVDDLDLECKEQSELMFKYSEHAANTEKDRDNKKANLEYIHAQLDKEIREDPDKYNLGKITEGKVDAAIKRQKKYQEAEKAYIEAKFEASVAKGAVQSFSDRKTQLSNLVELYKGQYFAGPSVPRDISAKWKERQELKQKQVNKSIKQNSNGRRKQD